MIIPVHGDGVPAGPVHVGQLGGKHFIVIIIIIILHPLSSTTWENKSRWCQVVEIDDLTAPPSPLVFGLQKNNVTIQLQGGKNRIRRYDMDPLIVFCHLVLWTTRIVYNNNTCRVQWQGRVHWQEPVMSLLTG